MEEITNPLERGAADKAMERGRQARRDGRMMVPPENESLLSREWWRMGWREQDDEEREKRRAEGRDPYTGTRIVATPPSHPACPKCRPHTDICNC